MQYSIILVYMIYTQENIVSVPLNIEGNRNVSLIIGEHPMTYIPSKLRFLLCAKNYDVRLDASCNVTISCRILS